MSMYVDTFLLQHKLRSGKTVVERFVHLTRDLSDDDRQMLLGWQEVVEGGFEVVERHKDHAVLHCLADDLRYQVYSNAGRSILRQLRPGGFYLGRIAPLRNTDAWMFSASGSAYPRRAAAQMAQFTVEALQTDPTLYQRNPDLLARAWQIQAEDPAVFVETAGSDLVIAPAGRLRDLMTDHYHRRAAKQLATRPTDDELRRMAEQIIPTDIADDERITLLYDEVDGLALYAGFAEIDDACARPGTADRKTLALVIELLDDESVDPIAFHRLAERNPDGIDRVLRLAIKNPAFVVRRRRRSAARTQGLVLPSRGPRSSSSPTASSSSWTPDLSRGPRLSHGGTRAPCSRAYGVAGKRPAGERSGRGSRGPQQWSCRARPARRVRRTGSGRSSVCDQTMPTLPPAPASAIS